jgi:hypothetical protein
LLEFHASATAITQTATSKSRLQISLQDFNACWQTLDDTY